MFSDLAKFVKEGKTKPKPTTTSRDTLAKDSSRKTERKSTDASGEDVAPECEGKPAKLQRKGDGTDVSQETGHVVQPSESCGVGTKQEEGVVRKVAPSLWVVWDEARDGTQLDELAAQIDKEQLLRRRRATSGGGDDKEGAVEQSGSTASGLTMDGYCLLWLRYMMKHYQKETAKQYPMPSQTTSVPAGETVSGNPEKGAAGVTTHTAPPCEDPVVRKQLQQYQKNVCSLKPLLEDMEDGVLDTKILQSLYHIWRAVENRQHMKAEEAYFNLTIGNDPWHLGVFAGDIHARKSRDRITRGALKHIMNSETVRNYMHAVKSLMTLAGSLFPAPKKVGSETS